MSDKQQQIIEAAIRCFAADGVGATTARIAREAGVSNGTLFNYFESKQNLIDEVYLWVKERMAAEVLDSLSDEGPVREYFLAIWQAVVGWSLAFQQERKVLQLLKSSRLLSEEVLRSGESLFQRVFEALNRGIEEQQIKSAPAKLIVEVAAAQIDATIDFIQKQKVKKADISDLVETSFQLHWDGICEH